MTIEEAEEYYKRYLGHGFHMGREEPSKYRQFQDLNLPEETLAQWDQDLIEREYGRLYSDQWKIWVYLGNIIEIIYRRRCNVEKEMTRLFDEMEKMQEIFLSNKILIIEEMAGRTYSLKDGGVYFICNRTKQVNRMIEVMEKVFINETTNDPRYIKAVQTYKKALKQFYRKK